MNEKLYDLKYLVIALILWSAAISFAQDHGSDKPASLVGMISLIVREPVLRELQIEQDSEELLKIRLLLKSFPGVLQERLSHPSDSDREQKRTPQDLYSIVEADYVAQLRDLLKPTQFARLRQIHWQRWGVLALHDAELAEALQITPEQAEKLTSAKVDFQSQKRELESQREEVRAQGLDTSDFKRRLQSLESDRTRAYDDVLSVEQRAQFAKLKGRPFELAQSDAPPRRGSALAPQPRSGGLIFLANKEPVRLELGIENQFSLLAELRDLAAAYSSELNQKRKNSNLAERRNQRELESRLREKYVAELKTLLTEDQFKRLRQIHYQELGNEALNESDVASELEMTADQQQQIATLNQELVKQVRRLLSLPGGTSGGSSAADQLQKQVLAAKQEMDHQVLQILTESQQARFEQIKGKPFDLEQLKSRLVKGSSEPPQKK